MKLLPTHPGGSAMVRFKCSRIQLKSICKQREGFVRIVKSYMTAAFLMAAAGSATAEEDAPQVNVNAQLEKTVVAQEAPAKPLEDSKSDALSKILGDVLTSTKENTDRAIKASESSNDTIKWVYIVQSGLAALVGLVLTTLGGILTFLGFRSYRDFRRVRNLVTRLDSRAQAVQIRINDLNTMSADYTVANVELSILASIRDEEVRDELLKAQSGTSTDAIAQSQREARKKLAFDKVQHAVNEVRTLAEKTKNQRFIVWADAANGAANFHAGNLDEALAKAYLAKEESATRPETTVRANRSYWLAFVYARLYYERKRSEDKAAAIREFEAAFALDPRLHDHAARDIDLRLYFGDSEAKKLFPGTT
jgi:hypothetical protein